MSRLEIGSSSVEYDPVHELLKQYWKYIEFPLHSHTVRLCGVAHLPETLEVSEINNNIVKAIERAGVVFLESVPWEWENDKDLERNRIKFEMMYSFVEAIGLEIERKDFIYEFERAMSFFANVADIAKQNGKRIAVVDPLKSLRLSALLDRCDSQIDLAKLVFGGGGIGALVIEELLRKQKNKKQMVSTHGPLLTRRRFLQGALASFAAVPLLSKIASDELPLHSIEGRRTKGRLGILLYDMFDYRNVCVANAVYEFSKMESVAAVYGSAHVADISHYAQHDGERDIKKTMYAQYENVVPGSLRVYRHNGVGWIGDTGK